MRKITTVLALLITLHCTAQYAGMDSVRFGTSNIKALVYPSAANRVPGKKYALMIHHPGNGEVGTVLSVLFANGFPRQVSTGAIAGTLADSIIHVCPLPTTSGANRYPSMFNQIMDWALANLPIDTTKYSNGMYRYICVGGYSQGANDAWDNLAWYTTGNGTLKYTLKISHAYFFSLPNIYPAQAAFTNYVGTRTKFMHEQNTTNPCCSPTPAHAISDSLNLRANTFSRFTAETFSGNGHNQFTWDSMYSGRGTDSTTNIYMWLLGQGAPVSPSTKIPIYQTSLYDLSGRLLHKDRPFNFFDGNPSVDPKAGDNTFNAILIPNEKNRLQLIRGDTTTATPGSGRDAAYFYGATDGSLAFAGYYFPGKRGRCIVVDLCNEKNVKLALVTHGKKWNITDIYGFEKNFEAGDSLVFYNFDKVIEEPDVNKRAYMISRPDSLLPVMAALVTVGGTGSSGAWRNVTVNDSCRYVMIRNTLTQRSGYKSTAEFPELVFYGTPRGDTAKLWSGYTGPLPVQKTLLDKSGINTGVQITHANVDIVKSTREYSNTDWFDDDTVRANRGKQLFNANKFPGYKAWYEAFATNNRLIWQAIFGAAKFCGVDAGGASVRNNIDSFKTEPGVPIHYKNQGRLFWQMGVKFGVGGSDSRYRFYNDTEFPGIHLGWYKAIEFGNEDDTYQPPAVDAARMTMSIDGNNGRFGDSCGVAYGDPSMKRIYAGLTYPDTFRMRTVYWLMEIMRNDTTTRMFDVINYHDYSRRLDTVQGIVGPTFDEQIGNRGLIGEKNDWLNHCDAIGKFMWNITGDTAIKVWNTEYGWDNNPSYPTTTGQVAALVTTTGTPVFTGYDSCQGKGVGLMRLELMMAASSLDGYTEFNAHNGSLDQTNNVNLNFYTCGWGGGTYDLSTKFPNFYIKRWMYNRMGSYYIDQVIHSDSTDFWVMKWRKRGQTDSVMYSIWKGSQTGDSTVSRTINVGVLAGDNIRTEMYSYASDAAVVGILNGHGTISVNAYEMPTFLFVKESSDPGPSTIIRIKAGRGRVVP